MPNGEIRVKSWNEIARDFDPMMPQELYDSMRLKYFSDFVAPKVPKGKSVEATYAEFKGLTERPKLLDAGGKALLHVKLGAAAAAEGMLEPLRDLHPDFRRAYDAVQKQDLALTTMANREGMNTTVPKVAGSLVGAGVDFAVLAEVLGPASFGLAGEMASSARGVQLAGRILRGGLTFGTYDALSAEQGNRLMAGMKGFAIGASFDLALGASGFLRSRGVTRTAAEAEEVLKAANAGNIRNPKIDVTVAEKVKHDAEVSRLELRPERGSWSYTLGQRGSRVYVKNVAGDVVPIEIRTGREYETYRQVRQLVEQGGSVSHYETHPDDNRILNEFVRIQTNVEEAKYRGTVIRTPAGQAEAIAEVAKTEGLPAQALSKNTVEVATVSVEHPVLNKPEVADLPKTPEAKPSDTEIEQAMEKRGLPAKDRMFLQRQLERIWDSNIDYEDKRASVVMAARHVPELLPEHYRARIPPIDVQGNLVREVVEARVRSAAAKSLGFDVSVSDIRKADADKVVIRLTTKLTDQMRGNLQNALGPGYQVEVPQIARTKFGRFKDLSDADVKELFEFYNEKPEDFDVEAIRTGGEAELVRQLEVKKPELFGRPTRPPVRPSLIDKVPLNELREYRSVRDGVRAQGTTHDSLQDAIETSGDKRLVGSPAGRKDVETQLRGASLEGRLMGSIEDVSQEQVLETGAALMNKGWTVYPLKGYRSGHSELVYFRQGDSPLALPLINDYDQYISQQAGRLFDSNGKPVRELGDVAHTRLGKAFGVPESRIGEFLRGRKEGRFIGGSKIAPEIARKPYGNRLVLQAEDLQNLYAGSEGLAVPSFDEFAKGIGIDLPPSLKGGEPLIILTPQSDRALTWHERLHVNGMHAGTYDVFPTLITSVHKQTALEIAKGLMTELPGYAKIGTQGMIEEAFTHAATAVRFGDKPYLEHLARYDRSVDHIIDFVFDTANNLLERSFGKVDTIPIRIFQRTLWDLMRRSSREVSEALRRGIRATGSGIGAWYDTADDSWVLKTGMNSETRFKDIDGLWDHLLANDKNFMAPSMSLRAELGGVRGPIVPPGVEPSGGSLPTPELPPEGLGMVGVGALWRPFFPWLATLHENMNVLFRKQGRYLPLYEAGKAVDDGYRVGERWLNDNYEKIQGLLSPFKGKKMHSVFDYLTYPETERTTKLMEKYGLTQPDAIQAHKVWEYIKDFRTSTGINVQQYMLEFHPKLRGFSWAPERVFGPMTTPQGASYWDKLIRHDMRWDPQDAHMGRFLHTMIREGLEKKFTGKALDEFEKLIERKSQDGAYIIPQRLRWPLTNYARYMRGIPDASQQLLNKGISKFYEVFNSKVKQLNEHLPERAKLPQMSAPPRQVLNRFMLMSYAMGLGMRPAIAIRDSFQAFTAGMTVIGPVRFSKAFTRFMAAPGRGIEFADSHGALLRKNNAGELLGDITQEIPTAGAGWMDRLARWSNTLLAPSRWGHNFGRAIMFNGEYADALEAIQAYRAGRITVGQLVSKDHTSIWFMDRPAQTRLLQYIQDVRVPAEDAATKVALEAVDITQWPYRRGTQPTLLRYGAGRVFGQYGVWPANYADFLYRIGRKWSEYPSAAAGTSAMWVAVNYSLAHAMESLGADTPKWFWQSPAGFAGSPHWDFVQALMVAAENTEEGHAARKTILEYPLNFVPAMAEMKAVARAIEEGGMDEWPPSQPALLRALGFRPLDELQKDQEWDDFIKTQLGYEGPRRRR